MKKKKKDSAAETPESQSNAVGGNVPAAALASVVPAEFAGYIAAAVWLPWEVALAWDDNPRDNGEAIEKVAASIERFGFVAPICLWTSRKRMVAGHTRLGGFQLLLSRDPSFVPIGAPGAGLVPVRFHEFQSELEADAYALADNKLGELARWNDEKLGRVVARIHRDDAAALTVAGYGDSEVSAILARVRAAEKARDDSGDGSGSGGGEGGDWDGGSGGQGFGHAPVLPSLHGTCTLHEADVLDALRELPDNSHDACFSDVPYGLGARSPTGQELADYLLGKTSLDMGGDFMAKEWEIPSVAVWKEIYRVLKPGAPVLSFAGSRTSDLIAVGMRAAGFELRDTVVHWTYACLSEDTEILVDGGWEPYHRATIGRLALCYDAEREEFTWGPIGQLVVYPYDDTAFRVHSDSTDQLVTRNHRCLVERGGALVFELAEDAAREREARVPVLEGLRDLLEALPLPDPRAGRPEQDLRPRLRGTRGLDHEHGTTGQEGTTGPKAAGGMSGASVGRLRRLREAGLEVAGVASQGPRPDVLAPMQRRLAGSRVGDARAQGVAGPDARDAGVGDREDDRSAQSGLEGRSDVRAEARRVREGEVRSLSTAIRLDGAEGRLPDGAPPACGAGARPSADAGGVGASRGPQSDEQRAREPGALRDEPGPQAVRASRFTRADLARFELVQYRGVVWCVQVPTGAFVARRNGKVFVTGNSGFPKSLNVERAVSGETCTLEGRHFGSNLPPKPKRKSGDHVCPMTPEGEPFDGIGTALKPSYEPCLVAQKPLEGTFAENALKWGVAGLAIEAARIGTMGGGTQCSDFPGPCRGHESKGKFGRTVHPPASNVPVGRWPSNFLLSHLPECRQTGFQKVKAAPPWNDNRGPSSFTGTETSPVHHADADGTETVQTWECAEGCPAAELDAQSGILKSGAWNGEATGGTESRTLGFGMKSQSMFRKADSGGASRFFFCSKASRRERELGCEGLPVRSAGAATNRKEGSAAMASPRTGANRTKGARNHHPCVKPVMVTKYIATLALPPKRADGAPRKLLVPYSGSGSEVMGALLAGWDEVTGIERDPEYIAIAEARIAYAVAHPEAFGMQVDEPEDDDVSSDVDEESLDEAESDVPAEDSSPADGFDFEPDGAPSMQEEEPLEGSAEGAQPGADLTEEEVDGASA